MTPRKQERLLNEILGAEEEAQLREATLAGGLRALRRRKRARALAAAAAVVFLAGLLYFPWRQSARAPSRIAQVMPPVASAAPAKESEVQWITADQLFALFPNRSMALIGSPGHQQFIFLDNPPQATQ